MDEHGVAAVVAGAHVVDPSGEDSHLVDPGHEQIVDLGPESLVDPDGVRAVQGRNGHGGQDFARRGGSGGGVSTGGLGRLGGGAAGHDIIHEWSLPDRDAWSPMTLIEVYLQLYHNR
jgi:hypothetical protein